MLKENMIVSVVAERRVKKIRKQNLSKHSRST